MPPFASWYTQISAVTATAANDAWAVGFSYGVPGLAVNLHWDGSQWAGVPHRRPADGRASAGGGRVG